MRLLIFCIFILILWTPFSYGREADSFKPYTHHKITILSDNDAYVDLYSDKYYSAGQRIGYTTREYDFYHNWRSKFHWLSKISLYPKNNYTSFSININQKIYTPEDKSYNVGVNDHPYAGGLYASFYINQRRKYSLERMGISLGTVGEYSFARQVQNAIHTSVNPSVNKELPWVNPVGNEFIANFQYSFIGKIPVVNSKIVSFHMAPSASVSLGNDAAYIDFNTRLLLGHNIDNTFGPSSISDGVDAMGSFSDDFSIYLYGGIGYRFISRNIYIQGNTWEDPFRHIIEPLIYYFEGGISMSNRYFELSYGVTYKSKEYKYQPKNHIYGTIILSFSI